MNTDQKTLILSGWAGQASINKTSENSYAYVEPDIIIPESKIPSGPFAGVPLVARCAAVSTFSQITVVPAAITKSAGT